MCESSTCVFIAQQGLFCLCCFDVSETLHEVVSVCVGFRVLEEQALRQYVLSLFGLPRSERLREVMSCSVWTPHARCHTPGTVYTTDGYLCFSSREEGPCTLIIPLAEVRTPLHVIQAYELLGNHVIGIVTLDKSIW